MRTIHPSVNVQSVFLKAFRVNDFESGLLVAVAVDQRSHPVIEGLLPAGSTEAPVVFGLKPVESELGSWCAQVVVAIA